MALYCMKDQKPIMETSHAYRLESELWGCSELNGLPLGAGSFDSTWQTAAYLSLRLEQPFSAITHSIVLVQQFQLMMTFN